MPVLAAILIAFCLSQVGLLIAGPAAMLAILIIGSGVAATITFSFDTK